MKNRIASGGFFLIIFLSSLAVVRCGTKTEEETSKPAQPKSSKFQQYLVRGETLYNNNCSNCHQKDGSGLRLVYPPLHVSDIVDNQMQDVLCIIRKGSPGGLVVNGKKFAQRMPGVPSLTDLEVAEIATFMYNSWGREKGIIEVSDVSDMLKKCL